MIGLYFVLILVCIIKNYRYSWDMIYIIRYHMVKIKDFQEIALLVQKKYNNNSEICCTLYINETKQFQKNFA